MTIRIQGKVTDKENQSPIAFATIELGVTGFINGSPRKSVMTTQDGRYSLSLTLKKSRCSPCYYLMASHSEYSTVAYSTVAYDISKFNNEDSEAIYVQCTEDLQIFNFELEKK
jgi:hypothetical protein